LKDYDVKGEKERQYKDKLLSRRDAVCNEVTVHIDNNHHDITTFKHHLKLIYYLLPSLEHN